MKLFYYQDDMPNFGDDLNAWLWPKVLPGILDDDRNHLMLGIGSILNHKLPFAEKYTVIGSGWGYGSAPEINDNWDVLCVRGKISCDALGLEQDKAIIDPAYLLQDYIKGSVDKKYEVSLIPHAQSLEIGLWKDICDQMGIHLIDPRTTDIEYFVSEVRASKKILTEAMHGAIISDCFGIPWLGYSAYSYINGIKWNDWLSVLNHQIQLKEVSSLYKGYQNLSVYGVVKNETKLALITCGLWQEKWSKPIPRKSSKEINTSICKQLNLLIEKEDFFLSDRVLVANQLVKLRAKINTLNK